MQRNQITTFLQSPLGKITTLAIMVLLTAGVVIKKGGYLSPGPISDGHPNDTPLNGYVSHADFETECSHCHAPIHCVTDTRCTDCHMDIARQKTTASGLHSKLPGTDKCQTCHVEHNGRDAVITKLAFSNVNHEKLANFSLAHHKENYDGSSMNCETCHTQDTFIKESLDCISCHADADHEYTAAHIEKYGTRCTDCHDGRDRMADFDHNTVYLLEGEHATTDCQECHLENVYHETPGECADCHTEPELHANLFGQDCVRCHTAVAWAPAQLVQHTFVLEHGDEEGITNCETCHAGTYTEYPCFTCHELEEMRGVHVQYDVEAVEDCVGCHPTGREGDAAVQDALINPSTSGMAGASSSGN